MVCGLPQAKARDEELRESNPGRTGGGVRNLTDPNRTSWKANRRCLSTDSERVGCWARYGGSWLAVSELSRTVGVWRQDATRDLRLREMESRGSISNRHRQKSFSMSLIDSGDLIERILFICRNVKGAPSFLPDHGRRSSRRS